MEKIKEIAGLTAITLLFSFMTVALIVSYIEEYNLISAEPVTVSTVEKIGEKGLFASPTYYVRVELPNGEKSPYLNRISKKQMKEIQIGDPMNGYSANSSDFSTLRDIIVDSLFFLFGIFILGFLAFCCLVALVLSFPGWDRLEKKRNAKRKAKQKRKKWRKEKSWREKDRNAWRITAVLVLFFLFFLGRSGLNLVRKVLPFGKTETEAMIYDSYSKHSYRKYEDSVYELTVSFKDAAGQNIQVIKDVTRHTYQQYGIGDKLPITYRNGDPYDVFVRGTDIWDILQMAMTWQSFVYMVLTAVTVFIGWVFYKERRKNNSKTVSGREP